MTRKKNLKKSSELLNLYSQRITVELRKRLSFLTFGLQLKYPSPHTAHITGYIVFSKGWLLEFDEILKQQQLSVVKTKYRYHLMDKEKQLIFRYDNVAHHPEIKTNPHHKHIKNIVLESNNPDLLQVIKEIEKLLIKQKNN